MNPKWAIRAILTALWLLRRRDEWRRVKAWWLEPFTTKVDIHERTRIEWRLFPPRLRVQAMSMSLQEQVDATAKAGGGTVSIAPGRIHLTHPVDITGRSNIGLQDMHLVGHGESVLRYDRPFDA